MSRSSRLLLSRLPFPAIIALRYLKSTRRDAFASFLSAVAAGGIALGVAALVLALAMLSGFQEALKAEVIGRTPELEVELPVGADPAAARAAVLGLPGIAAVQVQVRGGGWLVEAGKVQPVDMVGFEGAVPSSFAGAAGGREGLWVSKELAMRWGLELGDPLEVVSPRPTLTPFGPQPRVRSLRLAGTYEGGRTQVEKERIALPRAVAETLLGGADRRLDVAAGGLDRALEVAAALPAVLPPGSRVSTWQDLNRPLLFALRLEKLMLFVAVSLIVLVAAFALVADLALIISSKRPEIGMLGAMGAPAPDIARAFLLLGGLVAGIGMLLGTALGVGGAWILDNYRLLRVPGQVYFLDYVPFLVKGMDFALVLAVTLALALVSAFWAAQRAAALDPVEALRR